MSSKDKIKQNVQEVYEALLQETKTPKQARHIVRTILEEVYDEYAEEYKVLEDEQNTINNKYEQAKSEVEQLQGGDQGFCIVKRKGKLTKFKEDLKDEDVISTLSLIINKLTR